MLFSAALGLPRAARSINRRSWFVAARSIDWGRSLPTWPDAQVRVVAGLDAVLHSCVSGLRLAPVDSSHVGLLYVSHSQAAAISTSITDKLHDHSSWSFREVFHFSLFPEETFSWICPYLPVSLDIRPTTVIRTTGWSSFIFASNNWIVYKIQRFWHLQTT